MPDPKKTDKKTDDELPRARVDVVPETDSRFYAWLERTYYFRPSMWLVASVCVGVVLAPDWGRRTYPTDPALVGNPAGADYKADHHVDIVDEETTERLRDEAGARVPRVFDFDVLRSERLGDRLDAAFLAAQAPLRNVGRRISKADLELFEEAKTVFNAELMLELSADQWRLLAEVRYGAPFSQLVPELLRKASEAPLVESGAFDENDRTRGVSVQRVPREENARRTHMRTVEVPTLNDRARLGTILDTMLARGELKNAHRTLVLDLSAHLLKPTLTSNVNDTEKARASARAAVTPARINVKKGQMIIRDGEVFTPRHLLIFKSMASAARPGSVLISTVGGTLLMFILIGAALRFAWRPDGRVRLSGRDVLFLTTLFLTAVSIGRLWLILAESVVEVFPTMSLLGLLFVLPIASGAMIVRLVLRLEFALIFALLGSVVLGLMAEYVADAQNGGLEGVVTIFSLVGGGLGAALIRTIRSRADLIRIGLLVGGAQSLVALGILLFRAESAWQAYALQIPLAFFGGLLAGFVALAFTPLVEALFRYTTDLKLLELANLNHVALKELIVQAPGTYHHSIIVGSLVEAAAEAIGANALLGKVMAYYHDLGKGCNAMYFIENQRDGQNPHNKLKPSMSAMIIKRHVTDGLELATNYGLGEHILAGIGEHHGTTLIQFFYHKAKEQEQADNPVHENDYRYPGRKPQTRESALVMLGDSVEAASRSLPDPTHARLAGMVNKVINTKFTDGQLEECDLTLRDLHVIAKAFMGVLKSIYHHRVEYPDAPKKGENGKTEKASSGEAEKTSPTRVDAVAKGNGQGQRNADSDTEQTSSTSTEDSAAEDSRPDNIRRLGLGGR